MNSDKIFWLGWFFRHRGVLVAPPLLVALLCFRGEVESHRLCWTLGTSLVLLGAALRVWAQEHLHHRLRLPMHLTTSGPYQFVRNPLYIGNTLIYLGATVTSELEWMIPLTLLWCLGIYSLVVRYEEAQLQEQYGEAYRRYQQEVPRWLPRLSGLYHLGFVNRFFWGSVAAEVHCLLILFPYLLKEVLSRYVQH